MAQMRKMCRLSLTKPWCLSLSTCARKGKFSMVGDVLTFTSKKATITSQGAPELNIFCLDFSKKTWQTAEHCSRQSAWMYFLFSLIFMLCSGNQMYVMNLFWIFAFGYCPPHFLGSNWPWKLQTRLGRLVLGRWKEF